MRQRWITGFVAGVVILAPMIFGQGQQQLGAPPQRGGGQGQRASAPAKPTPHWPDGRVNFAAELGQKGLWIGGIVQLSPINNGQIPYQPWARAVVEYRRQNEFEPHTRCKPSGGARQFLTPYGVEFLDMPELKRMYIFDVGGPHTYRIIYMDGRPHPKDLAPSYYGHNVGHWEGETLVVDSVGYNEKFWVDRGRAPHTENLHMVERFTRTDYNTMKYQVLIDDSGAYTAPWTGEFTIRWVPEDEMFEYICQDNNFAPELMIGAEKEINRRSQIVP